MLTHDEDQQLAQFGCATLCIMRLAKLLNPDFDAFKFLDNFRPRFEPGKFGGTTTSLIIDMAIHAEIAYHADVSRDYAYVKSRVSGGSRGTLLLTERGPDENGQLARFAHCRLLSTDPARSWGFWNPTYPTALKPEYLTEAEIEQRLGVFMIFT